MIKEKNQLKLGTLFSYLNMVLGTIIPMFYTPIMLDLLGKNEYGIFKLASSATSYLSLLSFGFGSALVRYYTKYRAEGDKEGEENMYGLFNIIFMIIAILSIIIGFSISFFSGTIYHNSLSNSNSTIKLQLLVALLSVSTAVSFLSTPCTSVVTSHEKFVFLQTLNIITTVISPLINLIVLFAGFASIGMTMAGLVINIITRFVYMIYVRKIINLKPRYNNLPKHLLKEILSFSIWIFLMNLIDRLYNSTDILIIGYVPSLATVGVAVYSIGITFQTMIMDVSNRISGVFGPKINMMVFSGKSTNKELTDLMIKLGRLQGFIVTLLASGFITFGDSFINLWVGPDYSEAYWVALSVTIPACIPLVQNTALGVLIAQNKLKFRTIVFGAIAVANIIGTVLCVNRFGIIGASIVTGCTYIIGQGIVLNWYYWKKINLDIPRFWKSVVPIFILPVMLCIIGYFIKQVINFNTWISLFIGMIIFTIIFCILNWIFVMNEYEKGLFTNPIIKLTRKIKKKVY